ncbi:EAL-associated domain-containing protein [Gracilibacillus halophilus]|uniref:EAL-associated domain-containing protein n=1 Tax=Gracilibacillus halophilus TaxID=470864 RepID=UPI003B830215
METNYQFHYAWRKHGRYYQGHFISKPLPHFIEQDIWKDRVKSDIRQFIDVEQSKLTKKYQLAQKLNDQIARLSHENKWESDLNERILFIAEQMEDVCFRMYITDVEGYQQTANVIKANDLWTYDFSAQMKNWSWRPYFIENVIRMKQDQTGILSDLYSDIETGEMIRTFSYPLEKDLFLFLDMSSMFLDQHEYLLW